MTTRADRVEEERTDEQQAEIDKAYVDGKAHGFEQGMHAASVFLLETATGLFEKGNDEKAKEFRFYSRILRDRAKTGK